MRRSICFVFGLLLACLTITIDAAAEDLTQLDLVTLRKRAESGRLAAQVELAYRALEGKTKDFDENAIYQTFEKGAAGEIPRAFVGLGLCRYYGIGTRADRKQSNADHKQAAELGDLRGMMIHGWVLYSQAKDQSDSDRGLALIQKARDAGSEEASTLLANLDLRRPDNQPGATQKALKTLEHLALEKGNHHAMNNLADYYRKTGKQDLAIKYLRMSADANSTYACVALAEFLMAKKAGGNENEILTLLRKAAARGSNHGRFLLARKLMRRTHLQLPGEDWYQMLLLSHQHGHAQSSFELGAAHQHAPGYTFRDLDWKLAVEFYQAYLDAYKDVPPAMSHQEMHTAIHFICELYFKGGLGLKKDLRKCLETARPYLGICGVATAHAGRVLLHPDTPLGTTRQARIRGYACMLSARKSHYTISDHTLFIMRSRFSFTREEVAEAQKLSDSGFPTPDSKLLP
ncbi:MAG: sel1 repeat family protein [Akkermansiaceae bacterium]|nr:sel1 repeat family protein [Akkermansiaceae bacterium]